jgi:hypothetical protein
VRTVDLAVFADSLAAEAAALAARLERARGRLRQAAIEREAREALPVEAVARLRRLGLLEAAATSDALDELEELQRSRAAIEPLQAWVERRLQTELSAGGHTHGERQPAADRSRTIPVEVAERPERGGGLAGPYAAARSASPDSSAER